MKTIIQLPLVMFIVIIFTSCSSSTYEIKEFVNEVPEWYMNPPTSTSEVWYEPGSETSLFLDGALHDARLIAENEIARKTKLMLDAYDNNVREELKTAPNIATRFSNTIISIKTSISLSDVNILKRAVMKDKNSYKAFVLAEYPIGRIKENLLSKVKEDEVLSEEINKTKLFLHLQKEVDDYVKWKNNQ